jgi:hypothetical protein
MHYVYILQCNDGSYYVGLTQDISERTARFTIPAGVLPIPPVFYRCSSCITRRLLLLRKRFAENAN